MAKKKTSVTLPGGIQSLVNQVQGTEKPVVAPSVQEVEKEEVKEPSPEPLRAAPVVAPQPVHDEKDRSAPAAKKLPKAEGKQLAHEYTQMKEDGKDSWELFLELAKDYKLRDSRLATVYIDSDLKSVLDRLKSANSIKMPSTALLSAIVARFVFDHERNIKEAIFGESLL